MRAAHPSIAVVGMACVYPDARTPNELWENVLAQRRAFRRLPPERLRKEDYWSADREAPDCTYAVQGAVIVDYEFDRVAFRVSGTTFRSADLAHWLALDVAAKSLVDAGFPEGRGLPRESTGVLLGNTLTGEFSRANALRLRWPYVRRIIEAALTKEGWTTEARYAFLERLKADYKSPFPTIDEETLAGGLSNTIAGRICNQFDFKGGGYTVDGACAGSLLAVANACTALTTGDLDVALAGGVDLSLDPFELVGFAKTGALAADEMRVFDRCSTGFWPGEGCGLVTLMRHEDALAQGCRVYAILRGWGISSDGSGGITRPESAGQLAAIDRAYRRAGFGIDTVTYCEGHGTGTAMGDATELEVLSLARRRARPESPPAVVGSVKANIGHTKAASGIAGLIKATMAVHTQVLPPTTGCEQPHEQLGGPTPALRVLHEAEPWPRDRPLRASVSAMGFGGINAHLVLESSVGERRVALNPRERSLARSHQDAELFLLGAKTVDDLTQQADKLLAIAPGLSRSELTDLAGQLQHALDSKPLRAAIVASRPEELVERLAMLKRWLLASVTTRLDFSGSVFFGSNQTLPRIGFLFPGQGAPTHLDGGIWRRRFESVRELYVRAALPANVDTVSTRVMQPAVVTASLVGLRVLDEFGLTANAAIGHSLGEFTALHWAGAFDEEALLRIVKMRGAAMEELGSPTGAMLAIAAPRSKVEALLDGDPLAVVGLNSPRQTVVAGEAAAISRLAQRADAAGWPSTRLPVSHAFHTPMVAAAIPVLAEQLARESFATPNRRVVSTITGAWLEKDEDLRALLCRQVTSPVRFDNALAILVGTDSADRQSGRAARAVDLLIEVGPGSVLSGFVQESTDVPVVPLDVGGSSLKGLLQTLGAAFVLGAPLRHASLFADRFTRPFSLDDKAKFFTNPCELAPVAESSPITSFGIDTGKSHEARKENPRDADKTTPPADCVSPLPIELVRRIVAERAELPIAAVHNDNQMLSDLHLNSITVGQLVSEAARQLGLPRIVGVTDFANASVVEIARALEELQRTGGAARLDDKKQQPPGVDAWIRPFRVALVEAKQAAHATRAVRVNPVATGTSTWQVFAPKDHSFATPLREALARTGVGGVMVCLPENPGEDDIPLLVEGGRAALAVKDHPHFVLVQHGWGGSSFARSLHLEMPALATRVVNVPPKDSRVVEWVVAEVLTATAFSEAHYTTDGRRLEPRLTLVDFSESHLEQESALGTDDVLLVTGGGKGIAAECALALGRETGAGLALIGRSDPAADKKLADNLARIAAGVRSCYVCADVTDAKAIRAAVAKVEREFGPVTAVLHGAGTNTPRLISGLDAAAFRRTVVPKTRGARNVLAAVRAGRLRLFITFGSIIARTGFPGEADYGTANEWLTALTREYQTRHPRCRCLALEWSLWSGMGMGERLGRVESLIQQGITPITADEGVRTLCELVRRSMPEVALVLTGRFGEPATVKLARSQLPLQRFLEKERVYYPGVELVVDANLSVGADPYLDDHVVQNQRIFPAVLGLEAMAQVAMAVTGSTDIPIFEQVEFLRPVTVDNRAPLTIRLASLQRKTGWVEVCLRSQETDFQVDHFRAVCRFGASAGDGVLPLALSPFESDHQSLDPPHDLYGRILFQKGRFCRLRGYRRLKAKECVAEITRDDGAAWFGPYLPSQFALGDPAGRDAALHAIQACIPHQLILPTGVDRLVIRRIESGTRFVRAKERRRDGNNFTYDMEVTDGAGEVIESWEGLHLRAMANMAPRDAWPDALLAPYVERRLEELLPHQPATVVLVQSLKEEGSASSDAALQQALGRAERIWRRTDGKPVVFGGGSVSVAHSRDLTMAVVSDSGVACDLEEVIVRPDAVWRDLLGEGGFKLAVRIAGERSEDFDTAATRLWTALECRKKVGLPVDAPLVLASTTPDGWVVLRSGALTIATCIAAVRGIKPPLAIAVALHGTAGSVELRAVAMDVV